MSRSPWTPVPTTGRSRDLTAIPRDLAAIPRAVVTLSKPPRIGYGPLPPSPGRSEVASSCPLTLPWSSPASRPISSTPATSSPGCGSTPCPWSLRPVTGSPEHLGKAGAHLEVLDRGFRIPATVIEYAARLLPAMAPGLGIPVWVRENPGRLDIVPVGPTGLLAGAVQAVRAAAGRDRRGRAGRAHRVAAPVCRAHPCRDVLDGGARGAAAGGAGNLSGRPRPGGGCAREAPRA